MRNSYKLVLCLGLLAGAIMLAYFDVYPAYLEAQNKNEDLKQRRATNDLLVKQLQKKTQADLDRTRLESDIQTLHAAVPKSPEVDLLVLDLEKICSSCNVDLVGVETPDAETLKQMQSSEEQMQNLAKDTGSHLTLGGKALLPPKVDSKRKEEDVESNKQPALKQLPKTVYVTGNYENFVKLMGKLEKYQRVIGVKNVSIAMPGQNNDVKAAAFDKANKLKLTQPMMSFLMIIYYLP